MPIDTTVPNSPGWWLDKLGQRLRDRNWGSRWSETARLRRNARPGLDLLDDYLRGDPPLPHVAQGWKDALIPLLRESRTNFAELVVDAAGDRMIPTGWTTGVDADESGDEVAARIATSNQLRVRAKKMIRWMLAFGDSYAIAGPPRANGIPVISAEDPRECITADDPATGEVLVGLKLFRDEWTGDELAYLYLPGALWVARRGVSAYAASPSFHVGGWEWDSSLSRRYPAGFEDLVPVVHFQTPTGRGEFETHLDVLNRINSEVFRRVSIAIYQAFRQRAVQGMPDTTDGNDPAEDGSNLIDYSDMFTAEPGSMWQVPADVKFWESQTVDLGPIRAAVKDDVMFLAAVTRSPLYSLMPDAANGSAEGATILREGLKFRVEALQGSASAPLERLISMAFRYMGETDRADVISIGTIWQPVASESMTDRANAASQLRHILPLNLIRRDYLGYRPEQLAAIEREAAAQLQDEAARAILLGQSVGPGAAPPPAGPLAPAFSSPAA